MSGCTEVNNEQFNVSNKFSSDFALTMDGEDIGILPGLFQLPITTQPGVEAYRRRNVVLCTNLQSAGPGDTAYIYPNTSTVATFLDTTTSQIQFDIQIYNGWFGVDYINFGLGGVVGSVISELGVYNQSLPLEQMQEYQLIAHCMAANTGRASEATTLYFSNMLKRGVAKEFNQNFVKPPMCSGDGNIMFGFNQFGLGFDTNLTKGTQYTNAMSTNAAAAGAFQNKPGGGVLASTSSVGVLLGVVGAMESVGSAVSASMTHLLPLNANGANAVLNTQAVGNRAYMNSKNVSCLPSWRTSGVGAAPAALLGGSTSMDWPDYYDPKMSEPQNQYVKEFGSINKAEIMLNFSNVKCFPIGMVPAVDCYSNGQAYGTASGALAGATVSTVDSSVQKARQPTAFNPKVRVIGGFWSGILGRGARKAMATNLLSPNSFYLSLKFADAWTAFQLTADPCRRIVGTIRDYIRNLGTANGQYYGKNTITIQKNESDIYNFATSSFAPGYCPLNNVPIDVGLTQDKSAVNTVFSSGAICGRTYIGGGIYANAAADPPTITSGRTGAVATPGCLFTHQAIPTEYALALTPWKYHVLTSSSNVVPVYYAVETDMFYGTNMPASVPQVRRIFDHNYDGSTNSASAPPNATADANNTGITYRITNLALVSDYITFPPEISKMIIDQAAQGLYNVHSTTITATPFQVANASTQSINIPLKVPAAKKMWLYVQDLDQRAPSTAFYYDSNCSFNIFAQFDVGLGNSAANIPISSTSSDSSGFTSGGSSSILYGCGVTNRPLCTHTPCDTSNGWSVQLKFGEDLIPPQPLTTLAELASELVKSNETAGVGTENLNCRIFPYSSNGQSFKMVYDCLQEDKFSTGFIPYDLLDDQTITTNYDMAPLFCYSAVLQEATPATASTGTGGPQAATATRNSALNGYNFLCPRGFTVPHFVPPSSRFCVSFNFSTWREADQVTSSLFLGNNIITWLIQNAPGLTGTTLGGGLRSYRGVAMVAQEALLRYTQGGGLLYIK